MKLLKSTGILFGITFVLLSCSSAKVISTEKIEVIPGVINSELYYRFVIEIKTTKETYFRSISLNSYEIRSFSIIDAITNLQSDSKKLYPIGNYRLQFELPKDKVLKDKKDILKLSIEQQGKAILLTSEVDTIKILKLR
jgi:hypothetical protein